MATKRPVVLYGNPNHVTQIANKRFKHTPSNPAVAQALVYGKFGDTAKRLGKTRYDTVISNGLQDERRDNHHADDALYQARQLFPPKAQNYKRWDMINPWKLTGVSPYGDTGSRLEQMVNGQIDPLPFANNPWDQTEIFTRNENFVNAQKPQSNRSAQYNKEIKLVYAEGQYFQKRRGGGARTGGKVRSMASDDMPQRHHRIHTTGESGETNLHRTNTAATRRVNFATSDHLSKDNRRVDASDHPSSKDAMQRQALDSHRRAEANASRRESSTASSTSTIPWGPTSTGIRMGDRPDSVTSTLTASSPFTPAMQPRTLNFSTSVQDLLASAERVKAQAAASMSESRRLNDLIMGDALRPNNE